MQLGVKKGMRPCFAISASGWSRLTVEPYTQSCKFPQANRAGAAKFRQVQPAIRGVASLSPEERLKLALEGLDLGWEFGIAGEMQAGAPDRTEAEKRLAQRWVREDKIRLRHKAERWKALADAQRKDA